ncbi:MAG: hypothetical protein A3F35_01780 [Candidatus Woykebacteria bacterium RIFCSPHIGHO2_12_FULL_45_10]|uniref:DDH domain-containing protein n=1 Tax=Candidatus Woykebacteria bacterium RIFCSPHIGHO2_12_FULL_45_10 TaxID=1802603 RepID=A0A1G1WRT1_9BACT|nr:MAG: hypothetical protein A3F35_01780 [Candidatus Woykebacteria bacterium RIFCSPHIGHO2_12_FULL_45_10]
MKINIAGNQIVQMLKSSEKTLVLLHPRPNVDALMAALALNVVIEALGKKSDVVCFGSLPSQIGDIQEAEKIKNRLDPTDLVIGFNWAQSQIEKVSYSVEGEKFNLIITPSGKRLDPTQVEYSYRGANYNLVVSLGIAGPAELPTNLFDQSIFRNLPTVNIDNQTSNTNFGKVNLVDTTSDSLSGLVVEILKEAGTNVSSQVAEYLMKGLRGATENFEIVKNPLTFEQAAFCAKMKTAEQIARKNNIGKEKSDEWLAPKTMPSSKMS